MQYNDKWGGLRANRPKCIVKINCGGLRVDKCIEKIEYGGLKADKCIKKFDCGGLWMDNCIETSSKVD